MRDRIITPEPLKIVLRIAGGQAAGRPPYPHATPAGWYWEPHIAGGYRPRLNPWEPGFDSENGRQCRHSYSSNRWPTLRVAR